MINVALRCDAITPAWTNILEKHRSNSFIQSMSPIFTLPVEYLTMSVCTDGHSSRKSTKDVAGDVAGNDAAVLLATVSALMGCWWLPIVCRAVVVASISTGDGDASDDLVEAL